ncbi:MAG: YegS/Rv2252/BmrU family lipid kinase [Clostridia bacterium]|nr:YegS/Rv2252/BmrU family lipid kinase [Clostridia bacterium]
MLDFITNPIAGGKNGKKNRNAIEVIKKYLNENNIEYAFHFTEKKGDGSLITADLIKNGATDIVCIGGDGTLHEVINGFTDFSKTNLGIIPCGTGNDFAASLNLPLDPLEALKIILTETPKYVDFMQMPTVRGLNIIGMGIDVDVLKRYAKAKKKTKLTYTKSLIKTLFKFNYVDFDSEINGEKTHHRSFIACIANGHRYGGGIPICPIAKSDDKQLDFVAIKEMPKLKIIGAFMKLKAGKILSMKEVTHINMSSIKIIPTGEYTVNVDGELYDNIPFEVKIVSDTLKVYKK